ncbi:MAG TPA: glycosyltransferase family 4 protein [Vicinamibacterales bacterium]|jgi:glycosyltransferase involved in cell wall biosynthesis
MSVWLLVAGDFTTHGGMDRANYALASYLATREDVHLVSHSVAPDLASMPRVTMHGVPRPLGAERFGEPILRFTARRWQQRLADRQVRVVANGGNVDAGDLNWVHYVHAAFTPEAAGTLNRARVQSNHRRYLDQERQALTRARVVICNSSRTAADVAETVGVPADRIRVVYYGTDPATFSTVDDEARVSARRALGLPHDRRLALFVGALGDRRKGFDTLFDAWRSLCASSDWDVDLVVAGTGAELASWRRRASETLPGDRMRFLGFRRDMPNVFAACDVVVHPARYEAYGLAVHEALCRGLPAIVTTSAGVAEQYPMDLNALLLDDPNSAAELANRLRSWRSDSSLSPRIAGLAARLRSRTWDHMARDIAAIADGAGEARMTAAAGGM